MNKNAKTIDSKAHFASENRGYGRSSGCVLSIHLHFMMPLFTVNALKNSDNSISLTMVIFKLAMLSYLLISSDIPKATLVSLVRCNVICNVSLVNNIVTHVFMLPHFPTKLS